jgi:hypothetical protein
VNIGIGKFLRDGLTQAGIESAFRRVTAAISAGFSREHREDGTHTDVTATTLTVVEPTTEGNITGSLIPTTATQDLGGVLELTSVVDVSRPWRDLYLTGDIVWGHFGDGSPTGPTLTRSSGDLTFDPGANGSWAARGRSGAFSSTLTVSGVGVSSSTSLEASTFVSADALVSAPEYWMTDGIAAPSAQSGIAKIYVDTADGDLKVIFGDGTVKTIATDT